MWLSESYQFVNNNRVLGFFIDCAIMPRSVANISTSVVSKPIMHEQTERDMRRQLIELAQKVIGGVSRAGAGYWSADLQNSCGGASPIVTDSKTFAKKSVLSAKTRRHSCRAGQEAVVDGLYLKLG